ncbi:MAG: succinylglutamate-semialdehyde dehydrogenase [Phycisphaeraceae bacterium]
MPTHLINGCWVDAAGSTLISFDPATGEACWRGHTATADEVALALAAARRAQRVWADVDLAQRISILEDFADALSDDRMELAEIISIETGKPRWEALTEVDAMIAKVPTTLRAHEERQSPADRSPNGATAATRYKPHGVLVVLGPFNFPGHVPNGHIVPALLAGNGVVFKPSELTPWVAQKTAELWQAAGLPDGVLNVLQGSGDVGKMLVDHPDHDGVLFTGSLRTGLALRRAMVDRPEAILALEMGGNNPLIVHDVADADAAAYLTVQSAYVTAGQRCTAARRLIVPRGETGDRFIARLAHVAERLHVGFHTDEPEPFAGPVISDAAAQAVIDAYNDLVRRGGEPIVALRPSDRSPALLHPALIDVTPIAEREDGELFGPVLQLIRVADFDAAIAEANATRYGLVAGLICDHPDHYHHFYRRARAGLINFNRPTTGASSALPFGGVGRSGNHRPSGYFAIDYCAYPVACLEAPTPLLPDKRPPGIGL